MAQDDDELVEAEALLSRGACCIALIRASTSLVPGSTAGVDKGDEGTAGWREGRRVGMSEQSRIGMEATRRTYSSLEPRKVRRI